MFDSWQFSRTTKRSWLTWQGRGRVSRLLNFRRCWSGRNWGKPSWKKPSIGNANLDRTLLDTSYFKLFKEREDNQREQATGRGPPEGKAQPAKQAHRSREPEDQRPRRKASQSEKDVQRDESALGNTFSRKIYQHFSKFLSFRKRLWKLIFQTHRFPASLGCIPCWMQVNSVLVINSY